MEDNSKKTCEENVNNNLNLEGVGELKKFIEDLKNETRKSFAQVFATLKARELKTLRQLEAIEKQCQDNYELQKKCVQNITISYDNESILTNQINKYGAINFEKLNFDSSSFILEEYISPNDDHMYSYKCIEETTKQDTKRMEEIEVAALKHLTKTEDCICYVNILSNDVSKKFDNITNILTINAQKSESIDLSSESQDEDMSCTENKDIDSVEIEMDDAKKIEPTDDWLNTIKSQTETEPVQATEAMEHSTITCL